jgi:ornithine cyclodeaminase/alanine dehydrogenase-like protein (mu-crystallin family)
VTEQTTTPARLPYLSQQFLESLSITTHEFVDSIEQLIFGQRRGQVWSAPKTAILRDDGRYIMATLAVAEEERVLAAKASVQNPRNRERGIPIINSLVTLLNSETGLPLAVLDGNWVTARRTAGLSAVAAKRLAKPDSSSIAFIGCGVEALNHLDAFCDLFPIREVRAFGRGAASRDAFCGAAQSRNLETAASKTAKDAIGDADIVVTSVTYSPNLEPFLDARWLKAGTFATMVDMGAPWFPEGISAFERIVIDDLQQEAKMNKPLVAPELVAGDLSGLVCGNFKGRENAKERNAFVFRGLAIGDLAVAVLAYRRAAARGELPE